MKETLGDRHDRGGEPASANGDLLNQRVAVRLGAFKRLISLLLTMVIAGAPLWADASDTMNSDQVIGRYLEATQAQKNQLRNVSMEVNIDANVPKLKKEGKLHALRKISQLGKITYKVLGFQGDDTIKSEVIARYLEAEQKGQGNEQLAITPQNYKFKYRGTHKLQNGQRILIVFLTPRKKEVGLFKGEMWLDANTFLPVLETGKLVKNPSVFFKRVEFVRDYEIQNGTAIPRHMESTIDARLVGKVNLSVNYSDIRPGQGDTVGEPTAHQGSGGTMVTPTNLNPTVK